MELEYKFLLPETLTGERVLRDPIWDNWAHGPWESYRLRAAYYRDPSGLLAEAGVGLRVRQENDEFVLTVKAPKASANGLSLRYEWNFPWSGRGPECREVAELLLTQDDEAAASAADVFRSLGDEALINDMRTDILRLEAELDLVSCRAAVCLDEGVLYGGTLSEPCRELEIELLSGDAAAMHEAAALIRQHFGLTPGTVTKQGRCVALRARSVAEGSHAGE